MYRIINCDTVEIASNASAEPPHRGGTVIVWIVPFITTSLLARGIDCSKAVTSCDLAPSQALSFRAEAT
jgi:hypothetical protein